MVRNPQPCPVCSSTLVEIRLSAELAMHSCSRCERRWWKRGAEAAGLDDVLESVAVSAGRRRAS
jgi:Zn-finger nucleic acid-binding protein